MFAKIHRKIERDGLFSFVIVSLTLLYARSYWFVSLCVPPIIPFVYRWFYIKATLPKLPKSFAALPRAEHGLLKLISDYDFNTVLDVGSGSGEHATVMNENGKNVCALDFGTSVYAKLELPLSENIQRVQADFYDVKFDDKFDCIWASHVLEHQPDPGLFIRRCSELVKDGGIIAITVPPLKNEIVGGHLTLWNAGLLLYQLAFNGIDCSDASVCTYGYNVTVIVRNIKRREVALTWDNGDITALKNYLPSFIDEPFDGEILRWKW